MCTQTRSEHQEMISTTAHRVEVLHPDSIHRSIKDQPLHAVAVICHGLPDQLGRQAILPVVADGVVSTVQLAQADALGVKAE